MTTIPVILLWLFTAAALYASSRNLAGALAPDDGANAGRRGIGHWLPVAMMALGAIVLDQPEVAIGVIFATSVNALTITLGLALLVGAPGQARIPGERRRLWAFLLPAALLALLAGFTGHFTLLHAAIFALEGLLLAPMWIDSDAAKSSARAGLFSRRCQPSRPRWARGAQGALGLTLAAMGTWAAVRGAVTAGSWMPTLSVGLVAAAMISPLLTLPMLSSHVHLASRGESAAATSATVAFVMLNLCALLPAIILAWHLRAPAWWSAAGASILASTGESPFPATAPADPLDAPPAAAPAASTGGWFNPTRPLRYPMIVWRVDAVMLVGLGLLLVPPAMGRWDLGRREGMGLVLGYAVYLLLIAALSVRAL